MRLPLASLLLLTLLPAAAQSPTPPVATAPPTAGNMATYHNDNLRLTYSYPASYTDAAAVVGPAFQASLSGDPAAMAQAACISLPLSRMEAASGHMGLVVLVRADAACFKKKFNAKSVTEAAQDEAHSLAASGAKTNFGQPVTFNVASHPATLVLGSFTLPAGAAMQALVVCVLDQPDIACWQFLATDTNQIRTMSAFPVAFDGAAPTPLVPADVLTRP